MSTFLQNILILGGLVLVGIAGYYLYLQNESMDLQDDPLSVQVQLETADFLRKLTELKAIELNDELFNDPRFSSLIDLSLPINPEPVGRTNPFDTTN